MTLRQRKVIQVLALFLAFSVLQVYVAFAAPSLPLRTAASPVQQAITARLITRGNQPVLVNGNSVASGATILTGATIETGDQVGATINLGPLGSLDLAPNTKVQLDYSEGNVKVRLISGCAILRTKKNANGEIDTDQGTAGKNDKKTGGALDVCFPSGASNAIVNQGAAANAGAGSGAAAAPVAGGGTAGAAGTSGGLFGLGKAATIAIIAGGVAAGVGVPLILHRGNNTSPFTP